MIRELFHWTRRIILIVGVLLCFFAVMECLRAYVTLREIHPLLGLGFLIIFVISIIAGSSWLIWTVYRRRRALRPPTIADPENPTLAELKRYARYLLRYMARLADNPAVEQTDRDVILDTTRSARIDGVEIEALRVLINDLEARVIQPTLEHLNEKAQAEVRKSVRDVMAGVAFSPYQAVDLVIVLYRNFTMVGRIIRIYNTRPGLSQQWRILSDIVGVIATVNYIDMGRDLLEHLGARVPGIGKFVEDIAQGTGAGFMTSIVGHAAIHRCRAFKGWSEEEARESVCRNLKSFYGDVKDLFKKDILPGIMGRVADTSRDTLEKVGTALDETGNSIGQFVMNRIMGRKTSV